MEPVLIVVADAGQARFLALEREGEAGGRTRLVEEEALVQRAPAPGEIPSGRVRTETNTDREAGPVHPIVAQRERHERELERRFARRIAERLAERTRDWPRGRVVLVAEPRLLGLLREALQAGRDARLRLDELAKDYTPLAPEELRERLEAEGLLGRARAAKR